MFAKDDGRKSSIGYYDPMFINLLERRQNMHPELFTTVFFIGDFGLRRIPRRGDYTEAEKKNVDTVYIKLINRWRKMETVRGTEAGLLMRKVYTHVYTAVVASLHFSQSH